MTPILQAQAAHNLVHLFLQKVIRLKRLQLQDYLLSDVTNTVFSR
jgi:hypothetical protein